VYQLWLQFGHGSVINEHKNGLLVLLTFVFVVFITVRRLRIVKYSAFANSSNCDLESGGSQLSRYCSVLLEGNFCGVT